jgi:hypothetical protein
MVRAKRLSDLAARNALASGAIRPPGAGPLPVRDGTRPSRWVDIVGVLLAAAGLGVLLLALSLMGLP